MNPQIDWHKNQVIFTDKGIQHKLLGLSINDGSQACATTLISRQQFCKAIKNGGELFALISTQAPDETGDAIIQSEIKLLLEEYKDVFLKDLLQRLSLKQTIDYKIELESDT